MILVGITFVVLLLIGLPIAFVLGLTGVVHLFTIPNSNLTDIVTQRMFSGINNFTLLAIPFFVLAGELMNASGITTKLLNFSRNLVGSLRGGLANVNVFIGLFLGSILGSSNADAAIRSSVVVPEMEKDGYSKSFATALTATSSTMGPIFPPSITLILYGVIASSSVGALFIAGIVPALLIALTHLVIIYFYAKKHNIEKKPVPPIRNILKSFLEAVPSLSIPMIILGGIYSGIFTPTEAGSVACLVAILVGMFYYKTLKIKHFPQIFFKTGLVTSSITVIIATANIFGWTLTIEKIPQTVAEMLLSLTENQYIILLIINVILLVIGMFMEVTAALLILVPVFLPVVTALGVDPVHFGLIVSLNLTIGLITPPVGIVLYVTSNITKVSVPSIVRSSLPFLVGLMIVLLIVTFVPAVSLWLPSLLGF
ncbi:TRAP transporter large permease [Oceanobacillus salinisoli]|uniref:TRAP transporter large permease n=1 Tax=Oceanobacillus salinisoli TaxID=2678611 RepID=UPI001E48423E|nr:TRAP transporter large permease [Oceanobacillus salinisoli]